ncbi:MAG TPA: nuclear transport factor 2 family protein [Myxococcales bacterium]|nr:nuclear transport factor 2 family protein [Myxococcales bacterium]
MNRRHVLGAALAACTLFTFTLTGCGQDLSGPDPADVSTIDQQVNAVDAQAETTKWANAFMAASSLPDKDQAVAAVLALFTDDMQHIGVFGRVRGKAELNAVLQQALSAPGRQATLLSNDGWALDRNHLVSITHFDNSFIGPDGQRLTFHLRALRALERQRDGTYLVVSEHTSPGVPLPPPPSAPSLSPERAAVSSSQDVLTALMTSWQSSFNARDVDALLRSYTRDIRFVYAFEGEEGMGKDALRADVNGTLAATPDIQVQLRQYDVVALGDSAAMGLGAWEDSFTGPGGAPVAIQTQTSEIFVRGDDGWRIRFEGASFAPPPAQ